MSVAATRCRVAPTPSPSVRRPGVRGEPSVYRPLRDHGVPRDRPRDGVAARFRVKGAPDSPTKEESGWSAPPGVPPAAWSVRMHLLARMVSDGTVGGVAADLGCGHGLLALGLVTGGRVDAAVGVDRSAPEVDVARENVRRARDTIETGDAAASAPTPIPVHIRLGDGAKPLTVEDDVDCLIVAGVGARTMCAILDAARLHRRTGSDPDPDPDPDPYPDRSEVGARVSRLVLNPPARDAQAIREYLRRDDEWVVDDERLMVENEQMHVLIRASRAASRASSIAAAAAAATGGPNAAADSDGWRPAAEDAIQWTGECGDELRMDEVADDVIGPVLRRRRPRLLRVYLRDRLEWAEKKRRAAKLRKGQLAVRKAAMLTDEDATEDDVARVDAEAAEAREEVRRLGAAVGAMASLLGEMEFEDFMGGGGASPPPEEF